MSTKHTAERWEMDESDNNSVATPTRSIRAVVHGTSHILAVVRYPTTYTGSNGGATREANARLIAAAPDLLLAAEEAMRLIELLEIISGPDKEIYKHELRSDAALFRSRIAPAIFKATGAA